MNTDHLTELSALYEISSIPTSLISYKELGQLVLDKATRVLGAPIALLYRQDGDGPPLRLWTAQGVPVAAVAELLPESKVITQALTKDQPVPVEGADAVLAVGLLPINYPARQGLCLSIRSGDSAIALLCVFRLTAQPFTRSEVALFNVLADRTGTALETIRLFEEAERRQRALEKEIAVRKRIEKALRESEASFRNIFENSPVGIYRTTPDGQILMANPALVRMLGFSSFEELAARDLEDGGYEPQYPRSVFKERIEREGQVMGLEAAWVRDDGSTLYILESATAIRDEDGNTLYYEGAIEDITKRKLAEKKLEQRAAELALLNDIGGKIAAVLDLDSLLESAVGLVRESFGYHHVGLFTLDHDRDELVMRARAGSFAHLFPPDHRLKSGQGIVGWVAQAGEKLLVNDVRTNMRYVNLFPDLIPTRAELSVPIRVSDQVLGVLDVQSPQLNAFDENDVIVMETLADQIAVALENARLYEAVHRELTERSRAEAALQSYAAKLEQTNRDLSDFVFVASHDLQEPLRKIQTFGARIKLTHADALDDQGHDHLARMQKAAGRMRNLLNALLSYSRAMTRTQNFVSVDLAQLVRVVLSDLETYIEQVDGQVKVGQLPTIEADPAQIRQLLQHLISNGLKFHRSEEPPLVKVHSQRVKRPAGQSNESSADGELCQIIVQDNGIGFDEKYLIRLFQVFQRLHGRNEYEGTGIGLATCRKIAERHGGSITAQSTPGQGSTFIVTLPVTQPNGENAL